jgi:hypothetical protein
VLAEMLHQRLLSAENSCFALSSLSCQHKFWIGTVSPLGCFSNICSFTNRAEKTWSHIHWHSQE